MKEKDTFGKRVLWLAVILGFTLAFLAIGCMAGRLAEMLIGKAVDIAGWGGVFGLVGFFIGVLFLMQQNRNSSARSAHLLRRPCENDSGVQKAHRRRRF